MRIAFTKAFIASVFLGAFSALTAASVVQGAEETACNFQTQLEAVKAAAEDKGLDTVQRIRAELFARKSMLKNVVDCAAQDAEKLKNEVASATVPQEGEIRQIQNQIAGDLNAAVQYYAIQKIKIESVGLRGSQELARDIKEWRTISYNPLAQKAVNFIAWSKNQELIQTARNRLNQIRRTVTVLKLLNDEEFQNLFNRADGYFSQAVAANQKALETFTRLGNPENALIFIKAALDELAQTYQEFFTISERINTLLPSK